MGLIDLDELIMSCRTEEAKSYVSEAAACYNAGVFRAQIAVVYDLSAKIGALSLGSV
jgi:hypothetical protein